MGSCCASTCVLGMQTKVCVLLHVILLTCYVRSLCGLLSSCKRCLRCAAALDHDAMALMLPSTMVKPPVFNPSVALRIRAGWQHFLHPPASCGVTIATSAAAGWHPLNVCCVQCVLCWCAVLGVCSGACAGMTNGATAVARAFVHPLLSQSCAARSYYTCARHSLLHMSCDAGSCLSCICKVAGLSNDLWDASVLHVVCPRQSLLGSITQRSGCNHSLLTLQLMECCRSHARQVLGILYNCSLCAGASPASAWPAVLPCPLAMHMLLWQCVALVQGVTCHMPLMHFTYYCTCGTHDAGPCTMHTICPHVGVIAHQCMKQCRAVGLAK